MKRRDFVRLGWATVTRVAEKRSRGESFCLHGRILAPYSPSNGITQEGITAQAFWQILYQHGADLVLNGHDHLYARYRQLDPSGNCDPKRGIREFVVGTGGETLDTIVNTTVTSGAGETYLEDPGGHPNFNEVNLEAGTGSYWGVMGLRLEKNEYSWKYESVLELPGATTPSPYIDKGVGSCHGSN